MANKFWYGDTYALSYDAGAHAPVEGEVIHGATSAATGIVRGWAIDSGAWATSDAAGTIWIHTVTGTWVNDEAIHDSGNTVIAVAASAAIDKLGDVSVPGNWGGGASAAIPVNADAVYLENSSQGMTAGLDQSAVALASLNIAQSFTGEIGTAAAYLQVGAALVNIGYHFGPGEAEGSAMIKLDLGSVTASTIIVYNAGISADSTRPAIRLKYVNVATTLEVRKGEVGVAIETAEVSTGSVISLGYVDNIESDAKVYIGAGVTLTTLTKKGGECLLRCAATTVNNYAGELVTEGTGAIITMNVYDGKVTSNSTGTITNLNISSKGTVDFTKSQQARTVTTPKIDDEAMVKYDPAVITLTAKFTSNRPVTLQASAA